MHFPENIPHRQSGDSNAVRPAAADAAPASEPAPAMFADRGSSMAAADRLKTPTLRAFIGEVLDRRIPAFEDCDREDDIARLSTYFRQLRPDAVKTILEHAWVIARSALPDDIIDNAFHELPLEEDEHARGFLQNVVIPLADARVAELHPRRPQ